MIVDLHAHHAMHLIPQATGTPIDMLSTAKGRGRLRDRIRARLIGFASRFANYRSFESGPRVTIPAYLPRLMRQLDVVETDIRERHQGEAAVVHDPVALQRRGVAYIVLPHLLWRGVATNAPALPFLPDWLYRLLFPQPKLGLSELGRAAVRAMVREGVVIDLSHMSTRALADTFELLDELDLDRRVPVIASHSAFRFGRQECGVDEETIGRIASRDGVVGLIVAQHQLTTACATVERRALRSPSG